MRKYLIVAALILCAGCDVNIVTRGGNTTEGAVPVISDAAEKATAAVEGVTGKPVMSEETAAGAESVSGKIGAAAGAVKTVVEVGTKLLSPEKKPFGEATVAALGALIALAGGAANYFRNRKTAAIKMASSMADRMDRGGILVTEEAAKVGLSEDLAKVYEERVSNGLSVKSTGS